MYALMSYISRTKHFSNLISGMAAIDFFLCYSSLVVLLPVQCSIVLILALKPASTPMRGDRPIQALNSTKSFFHEGEESTLVVIKFPVIRD